VANQNFRVKTGLEVGTGVTISAGIVTAVSFRGDGSALTGVAVTTDVRTNSLIVSGVSTLGNTIVGGGTTQLIVNGDARITGILTIGTSSITLDGSNNRIVLGTGTTISSTGAATFNNGLVVTGVVTATTFNGSGSLLTSIPNSALSNSTISGVSLGSNLNTLTLNTSGTGLSGSTTYNGSGSATFTVASNATSANTGSTIVARDSSGNFSAGTITATLSGTATQVSNTLTLNTSGTGLSGSTTFNGSGASTFTVTSNATSSNTASAIVARDASGNFSAGAITGTSVSDSSGNVRAIPQNSQTSAYILAIGDVGKHISITTGGVTVNASIFSAGDAVTIYNNSGSNQTITQGTSVTLRSAGTANTGNRTLAQYGVCTVLCVASNTFVISGAGLS
jgi:hypothetical protein